MRISAAVLSLVLAGSGSTLAVAVENAVPGMTLEVPGEPAFAGPMSTDRLAPVETVETSRSDEIESCVPPAAAFQDMAQRFEADPEGFMERYSSFGASAAVPLRNAVMARPDLLPLAIDMIRSVARGSERARQIAVGLGQASLLCVATAPNTALRFQEAVLELQDDFVTQNFAAAAGDTGTGALSGGGVAGATSGAGGGGGPGLTASPTLGAFGAWTTGSAPQPNPQFSFRRVQILTIFETSSSSGTVSRTTP